MTAAAIVKELQKLPLAEKLLVIERALKSIRLEKEHELQHAVDALYDDYKKNKELTAFTGLDAESFYEAR